MQDLKKFNKKTQQLEFEEFIVEVACKTTVLTAFGTLLTFLFLAQAITKETIMYDMKDYGKNTKKLNLERRLTDVSMWIIILILIGVVVTLPLFI